MKGINQALQLRDILKALLRKPKLYEFHNISKPPLKNHVPLQFRNQLKVCFANQALRIPVEFFSSA